jgi:imidazolonepropionase-like amidohydrolase
VNIARRTFLLATALAPLARAAEGETVAIVHGTAWLPGGAREDDVTVVIAGDRVRAVGKGLAAPAGARVVDATGKVVTPGFIDAASHAGLAEVDAEPQANDASVSGDPLHPALRALDAYDPRSTSVAVAHQGGVTSAVIAPAEGVLRGQSAFVDLAGDAVADALVRPALAQHLSVADGDAHALGGSRAVLWTRLREVFDDARAFATRRSQWEDNRSRPFALGRVQLEALGPVLRREQPLVVTAHRQSDIEAALRLADDHRLRLIFAGATEAWRVADELARRAIPVIVHPTENLPTTFDQIHVVPDLAARLHRAGVALLVSTFDVHQVRLLWQEAGNAVRMGLPMRRRCAR